MVCLTTVFAFITLFVAAISAPAKRQAHNDLFLVPALEDEVNKLSLDTTRSDFFDIENLIATLRNDYFIATNRIISDLRYNDTDGAFSSAKESVEIMDTVLPSLTNALHILFTKAIEVNQLQIQFGSVDFGNMFKEMLDYQGDLLDHIAFLSAGDPGDPAALPIVQSKAVRIQSVLAEAVTPLIRVLKVHLF